MFEFTGTSTRSNRPQDTRLVFWLSLVKADIFLFTVLVILTLTNSSSLRSIYSEIFRPPLNPRLSKEASVLLWATTNPPAFRLKVYVSDRWSVWKINYFGKKSRLQAVLLWGEVHLACHKKNQRKQKIMLVHRAELWNIKVGVTLKVPRPALTLIIFFRWFFLIVQRTSPQTRESS